LSLFAKTDQSKPVKQEVNGTVILPPLVFPEIQGCFKLKQLCLKYPFLACSFFHKLVSENLHFKSRNLSSFYVSARLKYIGVDVGETIGHFVLPPYLTWPPCVSDTNRNDPACLCAAQGRQGKIGQGIMTLRCKAFYGEMCLMTVTSKPKL
jgi:hypothetical protein